MLTVISGKQKIAELQKQFAREMKSHFDSHIHCSVGFPGGSFNDKVAYSSSLGIWYSHFKADNRFWNGFGVGKPVESAGNSLVGEINFPFEGIQRRIAGVFAEDEDGKIVILHRGRIGGGTPGVGKNAFVDRFRGDKEYAVDGDRSSGFCVVGELGSALLPVQVANFIHEVERIKDILKGKVSSSMEDEYNFQEESYGATTYKNDRETTIERTHGIVVNALSRSLCDKGFRTGNTKSIDLFAYKKKNIKIIFEVKTTSSLQNLCTALGQLLIYSAPIEPKPNLILVAPGKIDDIIKARYQELGVSIVYFEWKNQFPDFPDLDSVLT